MPTPRTAKKTTETAPSAPTLREPDYDPVAQLASVEFSAVVGKGKVRRGSTTSNVHIAENHPLLRAFRSSYESGNWVEFISEQPDEDIRLIRAAAAQEGKGCRTDVLDMEENRIRLPRHVKGGPTPKYAHVIEPGMKVRVQFLARDKKQYKKGDDDSTGGPSHSVE